MSKALIYGLSSYTDSWARVRRGHKGFELLPANSLSSLAADLPRYPKLKIVAIACWTEMVSAIANGLDLAETLRPLVSSVYDQLNTLAKESSIRVSRLCILEIFS